MGMYDLPRRPSAKKNVPRWTHLAYGRRDPIGREKPSKEVLNRHSNLKWTPTYTGYTWRPSDERYLRTEFLDFNQTPNRDYGKFLSSCAYSLRRSENTIRAKLIEMNRRGLIPKRKH